MKKILLLVLALVIATFAYCDITPDSESIWSVGTASNGAQLDSDANLVVTGDVTATTLIRTYDTITSTNTVVVYGVSASTGVFSGLVTSSSMTVTNLLTCDTAKFAVDLDTTSTPSATGIIGITSTFAVYVSSSTGAGGWELIGSQS